jgi:uridine kinase
MTNPYIIGITGGSASGKTLFLKSLMQSFQSDDVCIVSQDDYYKTKEQQPIDDNGIENYDTLHSIDLELFIKDLKSLRSGIQISKEEYTFNNPSLKARTLLFKPSPIILVEGIFIFYHPEIMDMLDLKVYIDANEDVKIKRRITRDQTERGYDIEDVLYRYEYHVTPTYEKYIKPFKDKADLIIPNNEDFISALAVLTGFLKTKTGSSTGKLS